MVVPSNATDIQIALLVTNLLKVSKSFYRDFSALLLSQDVIVGMSSNMSGSYSNAGGVVDPVFDFSIFTGGTTTTPKPTTPKTEIKSEGKSWLNQGLGLLQTGFQGYLALDENKTQRELANASFKIKEGDVSLAEKGILPAGTPLPKTGLSTGAIIGISVLGIAVVGGVIYLALKKR